MALHRRTLRSRGLAALAAATVAALLPAAVAGTAQARMIGEFEVGGAIETEYDQVGGAVLGDPTSPEADAAAGGKYQTFANNAAIYWHPDTNAHTVTGQIRDKFAELNNESGKLGYPTTRELSTPVGGGRYNHFQHGSIYWSVGTGAHQISGPIRDKWGALGWESSPLGFPLSDVSQAGKGGQYSMFPTGAIYWTAATGAHAVWGSIQADWIRAGAETGRYGYPTSDEYDYQGGKAQDFQGGKLTWKPES
ncbi:LGFP repeat-containing protein [Nocardia sp. NPDC059177]|uniref:LGFP repeat-containing protein n=1 Tax=Nocardia sp. NPDC059177 TaxID=3346759 RepID=UPI003683EA97